ncbi:MAG TPA: hypothetical protein VFZ25_16745 [Chloroflexota bacterium]|nr:hypothetical protein [Chloroflexota bacterium]
MELSVLGLVAGAVFGLAWFRPNLTYYGLGTLCLLFAFLGLWLSSPGSGNWIGSNLFDDPNSGFSGTTQLAFLAYLFPIAWILLATSVTNWRVGVGSYLLLALVFLVYLSRVDLFSVDSLGFFLQGLRLETVVAVLFSWPVYVLRFLGIFGLAFR